MARAEIDNADPAAQPQGVYTDAAGRFVINFPSSSAVVLIFSKPGFFRFTDDQIKLAPGINDVSITLMHETELQQNIEVHSETTQIDPETTSHEESLVRAKL